MSLQPGQIIGDYEVIGALGAGGMGSVFKARNLISDRVDALKILLPDLRASHDLAERFVNEIRVLASLTHRSPRRQPTHHDHGIRRRDQP